LSLLNLAQGIATVAIDLNRTHATNPNWPGHARFHLVWQVVSSALLCALAVGLIWLRGPTTEYNFYLAAILTCIPLIGFMTAFVSRKMYSGALSDPNGIQPVPLAIRGLISLPGYEPGCCPGSFRGLNGYFGDLLVGAKRLLNSLRFRGQMPN
jgi:hypothetical protein